jgi:hypothetical protein
MEVNNFRVFMLFELIIGEFQLNLLLFLLCRNFQISLHYFQIYLHFWKFLHVEVNTEDGFVKVLVLFLAEVILDVVEIGREKVSRIENLFILYLRK